MKKTAILLAVVTIFFSCKNEKYQKLNGSWKSEEKVISQGHTEALSILEGFKQKIDEHKKHLKKSTTFFESKNSEEVKGTLNLEKEITEKVSENIEEHKHFSIFLKNLNSLQELLEGKSFGLKTIPDENKITKFSNLKEAISYWDTEKNSTP